MNWFKTRLPMLAAVTTAGLLIAVATPAVQAGNVLPPGAKSHGYSIDDMALEVANFSLSGNDLAYYPDTPFQILYRQGNLQDPTGSNTFHVDPGTPFYLKFFFIDDAPPVWGDFPTDKSGAGDYIFGRDQLGAHDFEIEIDGEKHSLDDPGYIGGPVAVPNSLGGDHLLQVGAFITPLSKGVHHITMRGVLDGDVILENVGGPFGATINYTVVVGTPGKALAIPEPSSSMLAGCGVLGVLSCGAAGFRRIHYAGL
jgi:hypothetical protein